MTSEPTPRPTTPDELPPVDPPSARFIMQLFVIPFIVVVILVCLLLVVYGLFGRLATGGRDATPLVQSIRSENENRRWRAAYELASLIYNEPKLARDSDLLGQLAGLLREELEKPANRKSTEVARYLALALGSFDPTPELLAAAPTDPVAVLIQALDDPAPPEVRIAAAQGLSRMAARGATGLDAARIAPALAAAAADPDPAVRQNAAYALGYFDSPVTRDALAQAAGDANRFVRYNAAAALARLGDPAAADVLREVLSTPDLLAALKADDPERVAEAAGRAEAIQTEALLSLQAAPPAARAPLVEALEPLLRELAASDAPRSVQVEARALLKK
jgi:HEAT repeat protein